MKRLLYYVAMFSFAIFGNVEVNASTSLHDLFNNESKTLNVTNDTISCTDGTTSDQGDYIFDNNTFYINTNTIPLLNNTGGGE